MNKEKYVLALFFREQIKFDLMNLIRACEKCGDNALEIKSLADQLLYKLEKYSEKY